MIKNPNKNPHREALRIACVNVLHVSAFDGLYRGLAAGELANKRFDIFCRVFRHRHQHFDACQEEEEEEEEERR